VREYACLMVRGYKTAETKKTAHLKCMRGPYVVLYASQMPAARTLSEAILLHRGHLAKLVDDLRQHWPDVSDVMLNSPWPEGCERSDGCAWALVLVGEQSLKLAVGGRARTIVIRRPQSVTSPLRRGAHARTCVCPRIGSSGMQHGY
jgi:hypothetical protein